MLHCTALTTHSGSLVLSAFTVLSLGQILSNESDKSSCPTVQHHSPTVTGHQLKVPSLGSRSDSQYKFQRPLLIWIEQCRSSLSSQPKGSPNLTGCPRGRTWPQLAGSPKVLLKFTRPFAPATVLGPSSQFQLKEVKRTLKARALAESTGVSEAPRENRELNTTHIYSNVCFNTSVVYHFSLLTRVTDSDERVYRPTNTTTDAPQLSRGAKRCDFCLYVFGQ